MRRCFEFIHDLRIFLIAFQVYSVSMPPSIVFISIDLCMDYVNRLYCNKWEKRKKVMKVLPFNDRPPFNWSKIQVSYSNIPPIQLIPKLRPILRSVPSFSAIFFAKTMLVGDNYNGW